MSDWNVDDAGVAARAAINDDINACQRRSACQDMLSKLSTLQQRVIDCEGAIVRRENVIAETQAENEALRARVAQLEGSIKQAIAWIDGDLREIIREVGNHICSYNDLYESADRIEYLLAGSFINQATALERQSEGGES